MMKNQPIKLGYMTACN